MDLLTSIERAQSKPLLDGIKVYATQNVQPTPSSLKEIVEAAGGQVSGIIMMMIMMMIIMLLMMLMIMMMVIMLMMMIDDDDY